MLVRIVMMLGMQREMMTMVVIQRGTTITSVIDMIISSDNQEGRRVIRQGREGCNAQSSNEVKLDPDDGHHD